MSSFVPVNLNNKVRVKLTEKGFEVYRTRLEPICGMLRQLYQPPKVDAEGYSEFQLHDFINLFGQQIGMGLELPCDINILVEIEP